jgi:hypothetical protein
MLLDGISISKEPNEVIMKKQKKFLIFIDSEPPEFFLVVFCIFDVIVFNAAFWMLLIQNNATFGRSESTLNVRKIHHITLKKR